MHRYPCLFIALCLLCIIPASCQLVKVPVCESVDSFNVESFKDGKIHARISVRIKNENWFSFSGDSLEMKILRNNTVIGKGNGIKEVDFKSNASTSLPMTIELYADSLQDDLNTLLHRDSMDIQVVISGQFSRLGILKTAEVNTRIPIKQLFNSLLSSSLSNEAMRINSIRILQTDMTNTTLGFDVLYVNTLPFDITLKNLDFGFFSDSKLTDEIGRCSNTVNKLIQQSDSTTMVGEAELSNMKAAQSGLFKVMTGGSSWVDYYMNGIAYVEVDTYPIEVPATIHFEMDILSRAIRIIP